MLLVYGLLILMASWCMVCSNSLSEEQASWRLRCRSCVSAKVVDYRLVDTGWLIFDKRLPVFEFSSDGRNYQVVATRYLRGRVPALGVIVQLHFEEEAFTNFWIEGEYDPGNAEQLMLRIAGCMLYIVVFVFLVVQTR